MNRRELQKRLRAGSLERLYKLADQHGVPRPQILPMSLASYERSTYKYGSMYYKPTDKFELELIEVVKNAAQADLNSSSDQPPLKAPSGRTTASKINSDITQAIQYSQALITAFQDVLDYVPFVIITVLLLT